MTGKHIRLRPLELSDVDVLYSWENNPSFWAVSNTIVPFSKNTLIQYIESIQNVYVDQQLRLIIEKKEDMCPIGCIDLFDFDARNSRAGLGILIGFKENEGKGYASEALKLMIKYCFNQLNLHSLFCNILSENKRSITLFEKHGFLNCGTKKEWTFNDGHWEDEHIYQLINPNHLS